MKTFAERLDEAARQGELAWALAHLLVLGDDRYITDDLLQGDIELTDDVLFDHINGVLERNPRRTW